MMNIPDIRTDTVRVGALTGFVVLLSASGCTQPATNADGSRTDATPAKIQTVEVVNPSMRSFRGELHIVGTAMANRQVMVHAMEGGYVSNIGKEIGDYVQAGQLIAELQNPELKRLAERANAVLDAKRSAYERLQSTAGKTPDLTPLQMLEEAQAAYLSAKAELGAIEDRRSFLRVRAPFSGVITQRFVDKGALVQSGVSNSSAVPLVELQQLDPIRLTIPLPESDAGIIKLGSAVQVMFPEIPGESFTAKVSRTARVLDPASKTMQVEVDVSNAAGLIMPGMYAKVIMLLESRESVLSLPIRAQYMFQDELFVLQVIAGEVVRTPLRKGLTNKKFFEVLNADLDPSSLVIVAGKGLVRSGQHVEAIQKDQPRDQNK